MLPDLSIDGVLIPGLLAVAAAALVLSMQTSRLLASLGLYRLFSRAAAGGPVPVRDPGGADDPALAPAREMK